LNSQSPRKDELAGAAGDAEFDPGRIGACIKYGADVYNEIMQFLIEEASLLDDDRLLDWAELLAEDVLYTIPVRQTVSRKDGRGFDADSCWIYDDKSAIDFKVDRVMNGDSGFAEDPPSRTRRLVSNVLVYETQTRGEYLVRSSLMLNRSRGHSSDFEVLSGRRDDILRLTPDGWRIVRRRVLLDHSILGMHNLAVFV
jgi:3-phenylpropionate/cinnamic acid dioxygenase small subunit